MDRSSRAFSGWAKKCGHPRLSSSTSLGSAPKRINVNKSVHLPVIQGGDGMFATRRTDNWWVGPALTFLVLSSFVAYATFRVFENKYYASGPYLSPMYSPLIETVGWGIPYFSPAM